ncbi:MAG: hypothetical protein LQ350_002747 [Teloschistes chrysophthalmus]|nr:MAG: hypothetical protein LQ350_002747 [Niorma chrysophthalma]
MAQLHPICAHRDAWRLIKDLERAVLKRYHLDHSRYSKPGMVHMRTRFANGEPNVSAQCYTKDAQAAIAFWTGVAGHLLNGKPIYAAIFSSQQNGPPLYESKVPLNGMGPVELADFHSIEPTLNALSSNTGGNKWKKETGGRRGLNADRFPEWTSKQDRRALKLLESKDHDQNAQKPREIKNDSGVQCSGDETSMKKIDQPIIIDSDD